MSELYEKLIPHLEKGIAYQTALTLFEWDQETLAPESAQDYTAKIVGELSNSYMQALVNEDVKKVLGKLSMSKEMEKLTVDEKAIVKEWNILYEQLENIPEQEYKEYSTIVAKAGGIWAKAKEENDFDLFAPVLEQIIGYKKKFVKYRMKKEDSQKSAYDILLGDYENGFDVKELDVFFDEIKKQLVPFLKEITKKCKNVDKSYNAQKYPVDKQREFCNWLAEYVGFDVTKGIIGESAHPFTTNLHNHDVRISNHFYEHNLESAIFSIIHETGHALYEMGIDNDITQTLVGTGTSMGMHESQSRFYENIVGRSEAFWKPIYSKLQKYFPEQLSEISLDTFIHGVNRVEPGLIRTEADELSYSLHILIRYEIEKMIFDGALEVKEIPKVWDDKYEEYLGLRPKNNKEGVLQDIHWACGDFGYFPSYAIGSAVSAQIYYHLKDIMPLEEYLERGNLQPIREYLKEHIYQYGKKKNTNELLRDMMGEEFNADYYIKYLKEKYAKLYL